MTRKSHGISNTNQNYWKQHNDYANNKSTEGFGWNAFPFFKPKSPKVGGKDDGSHVEYPRTSTIAEFALAHAIKEKLQEPHGTRYCRK